MALEIQSRLGENCLHIERPEEVQCGPGQAREAVVSLDDRALSTLET